MTDQVASLVVEVDASGAKKAAVDLDSLTKAADRADNAANDLADSSRKLSAAEKTVADEAKRAMAGVSHLAAEQEAAVKTAQRLNAAHGSAVISSKHLNQAYLNLGRQFSDVGVTLASGMNPLTVLVQQGPQIAEVFATLKTEGIGVGAAFKSMGASLAPAIPLILGVGAAVGVVVGAFALFERAVDGQTKNATTFGDTWKAVVKVTGDYIMDGPIGDGLKWLGGAFSKTLDLIVDGVTGWYDTTVGFFIAAYKAIKTNWSSLPDVLNAIFVTAANKALSGIEFIVNGVIKGVNELRKKAGLKEFGTVDLPELEARNKNIAASFSKDWRDASNEAKRSREGYFNDIVKQTDKEFEKHQKAKKATEDHTKAIKANNDAYRDADNALTSYLANLSEEIATMGMSSDQLRKRQNEQMALAAETPQLAAFIRSLYQQWEEQNRVMKEAEDVRKRVSAASNDNIRTLKDEGVTVDKVTSKYVTKAKELDDAAQRASNFSYGIQDVADAISNNDWTSAFANLANVLAQVEKAFAAGALSADKFAAAAGVAQGIGSVVGGSTGRAISSTASGALTGFTLGGPIGAVIGGGLGLVSSIFGSSKAKKQQRAQEAAQRAAEAAQREQTIADTSRALEITLLRAQGKELEAVAKGREAELAKLSALSPALAAQQQAVYAALDLAEEQTKAAKLAADQRSLDIQLLEVMGRSEEALAMKRADVLAATDPLLRATQAQIFAEEDLAKKRAKEAEEAAARLAKQAEIVNAQASVQDRIDAITKTSAELMYAGRAKELAAADALDTSVSELLIKLWGLEDAAAATAEATAKATAAEAKREEAIQKSLANQATNIGLMRQLMAMDDAVLGTTSARDAARSDELAKLDATGKYLQQIVWARQDEADRIAKQNEAMAKAAELLKQRTDLENQLLVALGMSSLATERQRDAILKGLDPSLRGMQSLLWGVEDTTAAVTAAEQALTEARSAASQAYEREASAIQQTIDKFKSFSSSLRGFRSSLDTGGLAMNDPLQQYARTKADFERVAGLAASGNEEALGSLQGVSEAYLEAAKNAQSTNVGYFKDLSAVKRATEAAQKYADQQVDQNTAQLAALNAQVSGLGILNASVLSVGAAVGALAAATGQLAAAQVAQAAAKATATAAVSQPQSPVPQAVKPVAINDNDSADLAAAKAIYLAATGGVASDIFNRYVGADPFATMKRVGWEGDPEALRKKYGFATGGSFTVGGSGPPDSQVFPLHLSPGEMVDVRRPGRGGNAELVAELRALRQEVADLKAHTKRGADAAEDSATVLEGAAKGQLAITTKAA